MRKTFISIAICTALLLPALTSAHEVYVLDNSTITHDVTAHSPNPFDAIGTNTGRFLLWGFIAFVTISTVFFASIFNVFERWLDPTFKRLKKYAAPLARATLGLCLIACAYNTGLFGPELPFLNFAGSYVWAIQAIFYVCGSLIAIGLFTRYAAVPVLFVYLLGVAHWGVYMLNYANYLGEIFFALILGGGYLSIDHGKPMGLPKWWKKWARKLEPYAFPILRVLFGVSIAFASLYAKFIHSDLALDTIKNYNLTSIFHFEPLFIVLGAFIIEMLIGLFFIFGFEIRWTSIFFLFFLALSLLYFGEAVWPHLVLLGLNLTFLLHGYDRYSIEGRFFKRNKLEPVL
jgi:uncharacterized membrane protein YphA (DoxX/SURF4 family)